MSRKLVLSLATSLLALPLAAIAQDGPKTPQPSPSAEVTQTVGLTDIKVQYSSPGVKNRPIWGELVPYGKLWRAGANKATQISFSQDVTFGGKKVPAGEYSLFARPTAKGWKIVLNTVTELWGTGGHDKAKDAVRVTAKTQQIPKRERLAYIFSDTTKSSTRLDLEWDELRVSVPIAVDTKGHVLAGIDAALKKSWQPHSRSAQYLLSSDGDLRTALGYAKTSVGIKATWRNHWIRAQILKKMGKTKKAKSDVRAALKLGDKSGGFNFYKGRMKDALKSWK